MRGVQSGYGSVGNVAQTDQPVRLRADAARNLDRILAAARAAFAAHGLEVPTDEIARRAQVGKGTLYRRFPTKADLIAAIVEDLVVQLEGFADEAVARPDALDGVRYFLSATVRQHLENHAFFEVAMSQMGEDLFPESCFDRGQAAAGRVLSRAQEAGVVRTDVVALDLLVATKMLTVAGMPIPYSPDDPAMLERWTELMVAALAA